MQDKGFMLIGMVLIMLILAVTAISLSRQSGLRMRMSANRVDSAQNNLGILAAQEEGFWQLTRDPFWWQTDDAGNPFAYQGSEYPINATRASLSGYGNDTVRLSVSLPNGSSSHQIFYRYHLQEPLSCLRPAAVFAITGGDYYFADPDQHSVFQVDKDTLEMTRIAGTGHSGFTGDGGPATNATLSKPQGIFYDGSSKYLYIADSGNNRIRKLDTNTGTITTVVGNGTLSNPQGLAYDNSGKYLYIADSGNNCIRKLDTITGTITTVVGNGNPGYSGDGGQATDATLRNPQGISYDGSEKDLFIADSGNNCIRKLDTITGTITTVVGNGNPGYSGDGGQATDATLRNPQGISYDGSNKHLYIADTLNHCIREVEITTSTISTLAGNGAAGCSGDGGPAGDAKLDSPQGVFWSGSEGLFIADTMNSRLRQINPSTWIIDTVVFKQDPGLSAPFHLAMGGSQELYIADSENHRVRKMYLGNGTVITVAGTGTPGYSVEHDGGNATAATLNSPHGLAFDRDGDLLYIADTDNSLVRMVDLKSDPPEITTLAGNPEKKPGYSEDDDGGPATDATLNSPHGLAFDSAGYLYIADTNNSAVRMVNLQATPPTITTVAGNGTADYSGDGGPATDATLNKPQGLAFDSAGDLYIADTNNSAIRMVDLQATPSTITTVVGRGPNDPGDIGPATDATLDSPVEVFFDSADHLYIVDQGIKQEPPHPCIRVVSAHNGYIYTLAGSGSQGYNGTGRPAVQADLNRPSGLAMANERGPRRIYVADTDNNRIRVLLYKPVPELY
ncbi:MAG: hypothetical protein K9L68_13995 [Spirochaetales bacterium]|nr:hypothetical protein [Spirochaetales bacterium]